MECSEKNYKLNNDEIRAATVLANKFVNNNNLHSRGTRWLRQSSKEPFHFNIRRSTRIASLDKVNYTEDVEC
jgi:hypothetical protein